MKYNGSRLLGQRRDHLKLTMYPIDHITEIAEEIDHISGIGISQITNILLWRPVSRL